MSTSAVAVLADLSIRQARRTLSAIAEVNLVVPVWGTKRRWRMNDNARRLAERLLAVPASIDERERARDRLLDHYVRTTEAADDQVRGRSWAAGPEQFASRASALVWLDAERASLMAAVHMAAGADRDHAAMSLPLLMAQYLAWRRRFDDLLAVTRVSLDAARRLGDRGGQADALSNLGIALHGLGRFGEAVTALQEAAVIFRETGNCRGEAKAANNLGLALRGLCRFGEAIAVHQEAAAIFGKIHDRQGEGNALGNLGVALAQSGQPVQAIGTLRDAAAVFGLLAGLLVAVAAGGGWNQRGPTARPPTGAAMATPPPAAQVQAGPGTPTSGRTGSCRVCPPCTCSSPSLPEDNADGAPAAASTSGISPVPRM